MAFVSNIKEGNPFLKDSLYRTNIVLVKGGLKAVKLLKRNI